MPYTVRDSPAVVARIEHDLARVLAVVRAGDRGLRSLVLTGGFARGEGTVLGGVPQNDYDFVAIRGLRPPRVTYARIRAELEAELGLHIDLAPIPAWRLRWTAPSIFWYETALRGRVLWGADLLGRIPVRRWQDLDAAEGLRLLVNRAAGLLFATEAESAHAVRIQAAKALLASLDAHLLAQGVFAPSQTERWRLFERLHAAGTLPAGLERLEPSLRWAYHFKVDPSGSPERNAEEAWATARQAILAALPAALHHAGLASLEAYARHDGWLDRLVWQRRAHGVAGSRRRSLHPTGRVRVATLRLLDASQAGRVQDADAARFFAPVARLRGKPLLTLQALRQATLQ